MGIKPVLKATRVRFNNSRWVMTEYRDTMGNLILKVLPTQKQPPIRLKSIQIGNEYYEIEWQPIEQRDLPILKAKKVPIHTDHPDRFHFTVFKDENGAVIHLVSVTERQPNSTMQTILVGLQPYAVVWDK